MFMYKKDNPQNARSLVLRALDLTGKALKSTNEPTCFALCLKRVQFLLDLSVILQEFIDGRHDDGQPIGGHGLLDLYTSIGVKTESQ